MDNVILENSGPLTWVLAAVVITAVVVALCSWWYLGWNRTSILLALLRTIFLLVLAWCLLRPMLKHSASESLRARFVVALDTSESMKQSSTDAASSRWTTAVQLLDRRWRGRLAAYCEFDAFSFADAVRAHPEWAVLGSLVPEGKATHLRDALRHITDRYRGQPLAGMLVLTDGLDTRETSADWARSSWPCPIYTVRLEPVATKVVAPDLRVLRIETPRRVVVGWDSKLTALVAANGTEGRAFTVQLLEDTKLAQDQPVQIPAEGGSREVHFRLRHDAIGSFTYNVLAPPLPGEVVTNDNSQAVSIQVVDARNRLLYVENTPRFESKYLNRVLSGSRDVTPVAFAKGPGGEFLSFGEREGITTDMTAEQVAQFKIVILGDLDAEALGEERARNLVKFVEDGGSMVLLGGPNGWGARGFATTMLRSVLPVQDVGRQPVMEGRFAAVLTAEGNAHPAFSGKDDQWKNVPPVLSVFPSGSPTPGAVVLVAAQAKDHVFPLILVQRYGQGKVVAILTDSLWRWQLEPGQSDSYRLFWNQLLHWLTPSETEVEPYELDLTAATDQLYLGDTLALTARIGGRADQLPQGMVVTCEIRTPDDRRIPFPMSRRVLTTASGQRFTGYGLDHAANLPGQYTATAYAEVEGKRITSTPFSFYVRPFTIESSPQPINDSVLQALAESSGGKYCEPDQLDDALAGLDIPVKREERITYSTLWNTLPIIVCLIGLLTVEWTIRKWKNLA